MICGLGSTSPLEMVPQQSKTKYVANRGFHSLISNRVDNNEPFSRFSTLDLHARGYPDKDPFH